jgi:uncharacterized phage-like protein YoqJ
VLRNVCVTGYKAHELGIFKDNHPGIPFIKTALRTHLLSFIDRGLEWVLTSGQNGVELWAAEVVLELQETYPQLKLAVLTPFLEQEQNWKEEKQEIYRSILERADFVESLTRKSYEGPWQFRARDQFMLDKSDALLIVYDEEKEGTPRYIWNTALSKNEAGAAKADGVEIVRITLHDLQMVAEEAQEQEEWGR